MSVKNLVKNIQVDDCFIDQHGACVKVVKICKEDTKSISCELERVNWTEEDSRKFGRIYTCIYQKTIDGFIEIICSGFQRKEAVIK